MDGKTLRGSEQAGEDALRVVTMVGHRLCQVIAQEEMQEEDELAATLRPLEAEGLERRWSVPTPGF